MIVAVTTTFNEADIVADTVTYLFAQGVNRIYAADASTDATPTIMENLGVCVIRDNDPFHDQPKWIEVLAELARQDGAEWVIPFDADEFWHGTDGRTIRDALSTVPVNVGKLYARMWDHKDRDHRRLAPKPFPKVAFRACEGVRVHPGNHDADVPGLSLWGVLDLREIQFRSFEHMCRKSRERVERIDPRFGDEYGTHQRVIHAMDAETKREAWEQMQSGEWIFDPIPTV